MNIEDGLMRMELQQLSGAIFKDLKIEILFD